jgi:hypothetical protein
MQLYNEIRNEGIYLYLTEYLLLKQILRMELSLPKKVEILRFIKKNPSVNQ